MVKQSLLSTNLFLENDYFLDYVELIEINLKTKKERFVTQQHHIIPRCYYIHNNLTIDNSISNLVNLKYSDHLLAHYLLALCSKDDWFKFANELVLNLASTNYFNSKFNGKEFLKNLPEYQNLYNHLIQGYSKDKARNKKIGNSLRGRVYVSKDDIVKAVLKETVPYYLENGYTKGNKKLKNKVSVTNGQDTIIIDKQELNDSLKLGFKKGHSHKTSQKLSEYKTMHLGENIQVRVHEDEVDKYKNLGYELGVKPSSKAKKGHPCPYKGTKGIVKPHCKNKIWVNNGVINKRIDKSEIEIFMGKNTDFVFGMISRK